MPLNIEFQVASSATYFSIKQHFALLSPGSAVDGDAGDVDSGVLQVYAVPQ